MITFYNCKFLKLIGESVAGMAVFPFIFIYLPKNHELTERVVMHERVHIKQQIKYFLIGYALLYFLSKRKRYEFELEAYAESVRYGMTLDWAAHYLSCDLYGNLKSYR